MKRDRIEVQLYFSLVVFLNGTAEYSRAVLVPLLRSVQVPCKPALNLARHHAPSQPGHTVCQMSTPNEIEGLVFNGGISDRSRSGPLLLSQLTLVTEDMRHYPRRLLVSKVHGNVQLFCFN
jgi:hypothetical protein